MISTGDDHHHHHGEFHYSSETHTDSAMSNVAMERRKEKWRSASGNSFLFIFSIY